MASRYVYSGAAGAGTGADWANAHTTLSAAITAGAAGDVYFVAHDHAQTQASALTLTFKGTSATPDRVLCVNRAGSVPPVAADLMTGASVATTGANSITVNGSFYIYGITFSVADGTNAGSFITNGASRKCRFDSCSFVLNTTSASARIQPGETTALVEMFNCTMTFGAVGQVIRFGGPFNWINKPGSTAIIGSAPTILFENQPGSPVPILLSGLDLSAMGSGKTIFAVNNHSFRLVNCKLDAAVTIAATPTNIGAGGTDLINSGATGVSARCERYRYEGTLTTETTIVRTGGASNGVTAHSWKVVTTANAEHDFPFECFEGVLWNDDTGVAKTLTVHTVTDNVTLTDAEIWLEVEYLGSSGSPVTSFVSDNRATVLTTAANQAGSSETWTTTGLGTPLKQQLEVTFTPQMAGLVRWKVKVAKVSTTVYICPKAELA